jgi:hypothetical protein
LPILEGNWPIFFLARLPRLRPMARAEELVPEVTKCVGK